MALQCLTEEPLGGQCITPALHEDVDHVAVLVDGAPEVVDLPAQRDKDLVNMPNITKPALPALEAPAVLGPELQTPAPNRLIGDDDASFSEQVLDSPEAHGKPIVEPHGVADDIGRESVAVILGFAFAHRRIVPNTGLT